MSSSEDQNNVLEKPIKKNFTGIIILTLLLVSIVLSIILLITKKEEGEKTTLKSVVVIDIQDALTYKTCMPIVNALREYGNMPNIRGAILRINSPGGSVGGVQELYREILQFRKKGKVIISSFGDIAASGGYYIAMATDFVIANPGSIVGSIGVIMNTFNISKLANRYGIERIVIKAGRFKDILNSFRAIDPMEINLLQELASNTYNQFFEVVKTSRKEINENRLKELCDGRIFTGKMAYDYKMVDGLGGYFTALEKIQAMLALPSLPEVHFHKSDAGVDIMNILRRGMSQNFYEELKLIFTSGELSAPLFYLYMGF